MNRDNRQNREDEGWSWLGAAAALTGAAAVVGGAYYLATRNTTQQQEEQRSGGIINHDYEADDFFEDCDDEKPDKPGRFQFSPPSMAETVTEETVIKRYNIPEQPYICNLNTLLADIYDRHVALKHDDFQLHYKVFNKVFYELHGKMKSVDKYYERYSSNVQFAGSHFNRLKIKKPDEFDMDIVIRLPVSMDSDPRDESLSDIVLEQKYPGFVQLRAGEQLQKIPYREDPHINKTAYSWLDSRNYILRSKFTDWFKSVASRALHNMGAYIYVDGVMYTIRTSSSGPAFTIIIEGQDFKLDVDLVPALRFPESRWPVGDGYRKIPDGCNRGYWMVVPKPNKDGQNGFDENRSWRIALQDQENKLLHNTDKMRKIICLMKYLRDSLNMNRIASYYITTIFLNELILFNYSNPYYWAQNDIQTCYTLMINKLCAALDEGKIPYFWNKKHNLIGNLNLNLLNEYRRKINKVKKALQEPKNYKHVAECVLSPEVYAWYERHL